MSGLKLKFKEVNPPSVKITVDTDGQLLTLIVEGSGRVVMTPEEAALAINLLAGSIE